MQPAKSFPGYDAAGRAPSPRPSLQSDFLAGFLLFHITTIIKTPTTRERTDSDRNLLIMGTFKRHCHEKRNLGRVSEKQTRWPEAQTAAASHKHTPQEPAAS